MQQNVYDDSSSPPKLPPARVLPIVIATALIEIPTLMARFGLGLESTRDTAATLGKLTFGLRIHHGYIGLALLIACRLANGLSEVWRHRLIVLGAGLLFSDLIHHFVFLWAITGSPQFDFWYPR